MSGLVQRTGRREDASWGLHLSQLDLDLRGDLQGDEQAGHVTSRLAGYREFPFAPLLALTNVTMSCFSALCADGRM